MEIKGKVLVFKNINKTKDGKEITSFNTSVSNKTEDGSIENMRVEVKFTGDLKEKAANMELDTCYELEVNQAFLSCRSYEKDSKKVFVPQIVISKATVKNKKAVAKKDKDLPF